MNRIHIVGISPRSGTSLMALALSYCCNVDLTSSKEDQIFRYEPFPKNSGVLLTKNPQDIRVVGPSMWADPSLYVVCMVRDPRDCTVSTHGSSKDKYWTSMKVWKDNKKTFDHLTKLKNFISVKYEDMVSNPDDVQNMLCEKIPFLKKRHLFSNYHNAAENSKYYEKSLGKVRPISSDSIGKWKNHLPRVKEQITKYPEITKFLIQMGYEKNESWIEELDSIKLTSFENGYRKESYYYKRTPLYFTKKYIEMVVRSTRQIGVNPSLIKKMIGKAIPGSYKPLSNPITPNKM